MIRRRRALRIAVTPDVRALHSRTGQGRVWRSVLAELSGLARVREAEAGGRVRADVWLADGHAEPLDSSVPIVSVIVEAPWRMPDVVPDLEPEFLEVMERRSRECASRSARVISPSRAAADQVAEVLDYDRSRIDVVPHGVDHSVFRPLAAIGPGGAPGAAAPPAPYVLFASQIHPRKNLSALRAAMDSLPPEVPHALAIVGAPAMDRPDSADLAAEAFAPLPGGRQVVRVDGPTDVELAGLMAGAAAFCLPSLFEGFGLTALEAMACGAPVVASDRGALPEVVGDAGLVVAPDPDLLSGALYRVLTDETLAGRLREAGLRRAADLSWGATARGWLASLQHSVN